ncbi:MAG: phosphoribosylaminoimidazolesuccinocarboxamide synthase [Bacteroidetes bacterium]|nr:phosphoribosylaminoimidazolesuccinocarboxamide synthase [Bacteroidota bacterium]
MNVVLETNFPNLKFFNRGKVRDIYDLGEYFLMISTDRLSAYDVIMNEGIPYKGVVLTKISEFWFELFSDIIDNHLITTDVDKFPVECKEYADVLRGRSMLVKKAEVIKLECIVRGYITGSGLKDYSKTGMICGIELPSGLVESQKLPEPIFTPSTKADIGDHDENITGNQAIEIVGQETFNHLKEKTLQIYKKASEYALTKGIIIADTKLEFGVYDGKIILIDEVFTPDSSRFWPKNDYEMGRDQKSYDKQYVRNYLTSIKFNKQPPAPKLPDDIIENTSKKYKEALFQLTGEQI